MTGPSDLQPDAAIEAAAKFLASPRQRTGQPCIDEVRTRFGLTTPEAVRAASLAIMMQPRLTTGGAV